MSQRKRQASMKETSSTSSGVVKTGVKGFHSILAFITKFNNDWVLSLASGLAFNLMVAIIPIIIAILALVGFIYGGLNPAIQERMIQHIQQVFSPPIPSQEVVGLALNTLNQDAGALGIIAIVMAIIGGSGLFVAMEGQFDIIYQNVIRMVEQPHPKAAMIAHGLGKGIQQHAFVDRRCLAILRGEVLEQCTPLFRRRKSAMMNNHELQTTQAKE
jgi:hypothetical protein